MAQPGKNSPTFRCGDSSPPPEDEDRSDYSEPLIPLPPKQIVLTMETCSFQPRGRGRFEELAKEERERNQRKSRGIKQPNPSLPRNAKEDEQSEAKYCHL